MPFEGLIVDVWSQKGKLSLISFYNPCKPLVLAEFEELLNITPPVVWVGDFNAHNPLWGSQVRDENGVVVEELLDNCRLVIMNHWRPTRFDIRSVKMSCLDNHLLFQL